MNRFSRLLIVLHLLIVIGGKALSQSQTDPYNPKVVPPSPNAASLMKFGDIPVSYYTGSASVSVPVYTIECGDITVPISLSYNSSGIRLNEEASWVGLGWALQSGGAISRTVVDKDDFGGGYFTGTVPEINSTPLIHSDAINPIHPFGQSTLMQNNPYMYDFWCNYNVYTTNGTLNFTTALTSPTSYDFESDVYSYNFLGFSGKFIIKRNGEVMLAKQENIKIAFTPTGTAFTITDDKGFKYIFNSLEFTQKSNEPTFHNSSWYLSTIISPRGKTVQFNYKQEATWASVSGGYSQTFRDGCSISTGLTSVSNASTLHRNINLESIDFTNGKVHFYFDNTRADLSNGQRLNKITVFRKTTASDSTEIFSQQLYYSYFNGTYGGAATEFKRLRLDSVQQMSGTNKLPPYKFVYHDDPFIVTSQTGKNSFSIDHWGYYNESANSVLYPAFYGYFNPQLGVSGGQSPPDWWDLPGANRHPNSGKAKLFSLKSMTYPTGGKTELEMEGNDYNESASFTGPTDFSEINVVDSLVQVTTPTRGTVNNTTNLTNKYGPTVYVNIAFRATDAANAIALHGGTSGQIYVQIFGNTIDISSASLTLSGPTWSTGEVAYNVPTSTSYNWSSFISPSISGTVFADITVHIRWKELTRTRRGFIPGGGLRVKSITDYDATGTAVKKRKFDYHYVTDKEYSYGRRISHPSYIRYELLKNTSTACMSMTRFSSSNISLTGSTSGNAIGYDQVTEWIVDPANEANTLGKTVYEYHNSSDTIIPYLQMRLPGLNNIGHDKNGMLKTKTDYRVVAGVFHKVAEVQNFYIVANRKFNYAMKFDNVQVNGVVGAGCAVGQPGVAVEYFGYIYPSIQSEKVLLDSSNQVTYENTGVTNFLSVATRNTYTPATTYLQLSKTEITNSKNEKEKTELYYPYDFTGVVYDSLMSRNMVSAVIAQKTFKNTTQLTHTKTDFQLWQSNTLVLPGTMSKATLANLLETEITFNSYDAKGNILQYTGHDGVPVSFIWDYNFSYPVAKATNAAAAGIAYTSFEADATGNWAVPDAARNNEGLTGSKSFILNNTNNIYFNNTSTNVDYIISYWSKNGTITTGGVTSLSSKTGLTKNGWTYYEQKVRTTGVNITLTSSSARTIDELRLYPVTAQMETFTYLPLVGMSSQCSVNSTVAYYVYDIFSRLRLIRDADGNVIKTFEYNYKQ